VYESP
jgi:lysophospholipase L1-like esterase